MKMNVIDDLKIKCIGEVDVNRVYDDGRIENIRSDKNIVVNSGILLLTSYLTVDRSEEELSGITHLAVGNGIPDYVDSVGTASFNSFVYGLKELVNEIGRVVRWEVNFLTRNNAGGFDWSELPTNIIEFKYRLRKNEPEDFTYISEIGMFGGNVIVEQAPFATPYLVKDKGIMFSYKYYDPPIDKDTNTIIEIVWRINFLRG